MAKYLKFHDIDDAARWLMQNGHRYECCTQRGALGFPNLTSFWGVGSVFGGQRELIACYDAETKELAIWNTNTQCRFADPAGELGEIDLFAGVD